MTSETSPRPSQVTVAAWTVAVGSVMLVAGVFDAMGNLHSVDTREEVVRSLSRGSAKGLGISVDDALTAMRWALFVSGAAAAAAAVLGVFVLQRNRGARIALTVAVVPIVLAAPFSRSFLSMVIAAATAILWTRPARDWFAGRPPAPVARPTPGAPPTPSAPDPVPPAAPWVPPTLPQAPESGGPAPTPGWGRPDAPSAPPVPWPTQYPDPDTAPYAVPYAAPYPGQSYAAPAASPRPRQVRVACILTWVFSGLTALGYTALLITLAVNSDGLMKVVKDSPSWNASYHDSTIITAAAIVGVLFLLWCGAAALLAFFVWRGAAWAWVLLSISTGLAAVVSIIAFPYSLVHLVALGTSVGMLLSRPTRAWFARR